MFAAYVNICNVSYNFLTINDSLPLNLQFYTYTLWANTRTFRACSNVQPRLYVAPLTRGNISLIFV